MATIDAGNKITRNDCTTCFRYSPELCLCCIKCDYDAFINWCVKNKPRFITMTALCDYYTDEDPGEGG